MNADSKSAANNAPGSSANGSASSEKASTRSTPDGCSPSPRPAGEISMGGYARLLDGLLGAVGVDAAAIVGNSMGGFIGAELAISSPERVERLVLVSAAGLSTFQEPRTVRAMPALR